MLKTSQRAGSNPATGTIYGVYYVIYVFKRPLRKTVYLEADCTLKLRGKCRALLGRRKSARYEYRRIGANSFRIERFGLTVADVYGIY